MGQWRRYLLMGERKPILCLDFDGVLHSYTSGWQGATIIPDPPVEGAIDFVLEAEQDFRVAIYSSRSSHYGGIQAMQDWLRHHMTVAIRMRQREVGYFLDRTDEIADFVSQRIEWPTSKPPAMVTLDDRAITFDGTWPNMEDLLTFQPWNKRSDEP
jgi:hypothetical protein